MRWLFVGVVILNVVFFSWHLLGRAAAPEAPGLQAAVSFPAPLALLDERPPEAAPAPAVLVPPAAAVAIAGCPAVGPMRADEAADRVAALAAAGFAANVVPTSRNPVPVFWVHIPPAPSRDAALRTLRTLHARGVDSFVVAEGADANAISLGSFQSRDSALGVQAKLAAVGYEARIREQARAAAMVWVVLADPAAQGFTENLRLPAGAALKRMPCAGSR